jgi:hypothetical protein
VKKWIIILICLTLLVFLFCESDTPYLILSIGQISGTGNLIYRLKQMRYLSTLRRLGLYKSTPLIFYITAGISLAQLGYGRLQNSSPGERTKIQTDQMRKKLNFTNEHDSSRYEINLKYAKKLH